MKNNYSDIELINAFLEGKLSQEELTSFDERLKEDPIFRSKLKGEREIIEGIQRFRKQSLKNQLNEINISLDRLRYRKNLKITAALTGITITSLFAIFLFSNSTHEKIKQQFFIKSFQELAFLKNTSIPVDFNFQTPPKSIVKPIEEKIKQLKTEKIKLLQLLEKNQNNSSFEVKLPAIPEFSQNDELIYETSDNALDNNRRLSDLHKISEENHIDIENNKDTKYDFHYQFTDNKLYLFGDFSKEIYQIIELKGKTQSKFYLYFSDHFYPLNKNNKKVIPLKALTNRKLILKLEEMIKNSPL